MAIRFAVALRILLCQTLAGRHLRVADAVGVPQSNPQIAVHTCKPDNINRSRSPEVDLEFAVLDAIAVHIALHQIEDGRLDCTWQQPSHRLHEQFAHLTKERHSCNHSLVSMTPSTSCAGLPHLGWLKPCTCSREVDAAGAEVVTSLMTPSVTAWLIVCKVGISVGSDVYEPVI